MNFLWSETCHFMRNSFYHCPSPTPPHPLQNLGSGLRNHFIPIRGGGQWRSSIQVHKAALVPLVYPYSSSPLRIKRATIFDCLPKARSRTKGSTYMSHPIHSSGVATFLSLLFLMWVLTEKLVPCRGPYGCLGERGTGMQSSGTPSSTGGVLHDSRGSRSHGPR